MFKSGIKRRKGTACRMRPNCVVLFVEFHESSGTLVDTRDLARQAKQALLSSPARSSLIKNFGTWHKAKNVGVGINRTL